MPVRILIPTPLRPFTNAQSTVTADGGTVGDALRSLTTEFADLRTHLYGTDGRLRNFVNVYLNDDDIRYLQKEQTPVSSGDTISIIPSVAGGVGVLGPAGVIGADPALQGAAPTHAELTHEEVHRYSRHLIIPEVGVEGQQRLKRARVVCVGAGGLGSPSALYLAAAGVGTLGLVDFDTVDASNLQRQILYSTADAGRRKLDAAAERLTGLNPSVRVIKHETPLSSANALDILKDYDIVVDGADNFPTRYLVNDACVLLGKPNVYGSIFRFDGQATVFATKDGPCYRCLYPEPPPPGLVPSCAEGGVLGVLPGIIGTIQAAEAIKIILGVGQTLAGRLLTLDALTMQFRTLRLRRDPGCPICGDHPTVKALIDYQQFCGIAPAATVSDVPEVSVEELKAEIDAGDHLWILDVREPREWEICRLPGTTLIPLGELPKRLAEIPQGADAPDIVVHCKMGGRSAKAVRLLRDHGIPSRNLTGGILAWIDRIDPSQPKY
ncbi:MAG TPA: molybdopterin-synthase adenylyltransferase MoeB [Vicinamibacterales bacterium]|nr:molybdopterin-synthase adenylyltransferase MoeB [Vicinamibacterales bacterium]